MHFPQPNHNSGDGSGDSFIVMLVQIERNRHNTMAVTVHNQDAVQLAVMLPLDGNLDRAMCAADNHGPDKTVRAGKEHEENRETVAARLEATTHLSMKPWPPSSTIILTAEPRCFRELL